jgi:putative redox protein
MQQFRYQNSSSKGEYMKGILNATVTWKGEMAFAGANKDGLGVTMDSLPMGEPAQGPTPMELILQAAGGCSGMDVITILRKRRLTVERFEVLLEGIKQEEHPRSYEQINIIYRAKGPDVTLEDLERAAGLSISTYCSVFGMLKKAAKIDWKCELID